MLDQDDGIVVDEAEMEAFLASDDEDAREAKRAAERRARRQAIERKHAAAKEAHNNRWPSIRRKPKRSRARETRPSSTR